MSGNNQGELGRENGTREMVNEEGNKQEQKEASEEIRRSQVCPLLGFLECFWETGSPIGRSLVLTRMF